MAEFFQQQDQQDPDAIRKAILLRMFGAAAAGATPGAAPGASGAPPTTMTPAAGPDARKPTAQPLAAAAANNNGGNMEPGNSAPILSEADYQKQNPAAPHTPYVAPSFKQRLLEGLFAGMQEFGRPGEGARTVQNYLGDIQRNQEAENNFPQTSAADAHNRYMTYVQGAKAPVELQNMNAELEDRRAQAAERLAKADLEKNPPAKTKPILIADPTNPKNPDPVPALQNLGTGQIIDQEGKPIPNAKVWEKAAPAGNDFEQYYAQWQKDTKQPDTAANRLAAHRQWEIKPEQPGANDTRLDRSYQYNNNIIEKQRTPLDQRLERLDRVEQAINQRSAQADALIAPELLSVMVGGMGSGLRMNEAEIARIVGGRSKLEDLKAKLDKWDPRTGGGLSVTDEQRQQMYDILKAVRVKTEAKQQAFNDAQEALIHAADVGEHRKITAELKKKLSAIDSGTSAATAQPGAMPPGWK